MSADTGDSRDFPEQANLARGRVLSPSFSGKTRCEFSALSILENTRRAWLTLAPE